MPVIGYYGDSLIYGVNGDGGGVVAETIPQRVARLTGWTVQNKGVSQASYPDWLDGNSNLGIVRTWTQEMAFNTAANVIISNCGINDWMLDEAGYRAALDRIYNACIANGKQFIVQTPNPTYQTLWGGTLDSDAVVAEKARIGRQWAGERNIRCLDVYQAVQDYFVSYGDTPANFTPDGGHPAQWGHDYIANYVADRLQVWGIGNINSPSPAPGPTPTPPPPATTPTPSTGGGTGAGTRPVINDTNVIPLQKIGNMIFSDEFNGSTYDSSKWTPFLTHYKSESGKANWDIVNSCLRIWNVGSETNNDFHREFCTDGKFTFTYGYIECRAKLGRGPGAWPGIWTLEADHSRAPAHEEIDILEAYPGGGPENGWGTPDLKANNYASTIWGPGGIQAGDQIGTMTLKHDTAHGVYDDTLSDEFHLYGCLWEPDGITFTKDGRPFQKINTSGRVDARHFLILQQWVYSGFGVPSPQHMNPEHGTWFDYIRVWELSSGQTQRGVTPTNPIDPTTSGSTTNPVPTPPPPGPGPGPTPTPPANVTPSSVDWFGESEMIGNLPSIFNPITPVTTGSSFALSHASAGDYLFAAGGVPETFEATMLYNAAEYVVIQAHEDNTVEDCVFYVGEMIKVAQAAGKKVFVLTKIPSDSDGALTHAQIAEAQRTAAANNGAKIIDTNARITQYMQENGYGISDICPDGFTPIATVMTLMGQWAKSEFTRLNGSSTGGGQTPGPGPTPTPPGNTPPSNGGGTVEEYSFGQYRVGDTLSVVYDGAAIHYLHNGQTKRTVATTGNRTFHAKGAMFSQDAELTHIRFATLPTGSWAEVPGLGLSTAHGASNPNLGDLALLNQIPAGIGGAPTVYIANGAIGNAHIIGAIQSNNFQADTAGWKIDKNGTAEFNTGKFRSTLLGGQFSSFAWPGLYGKGFYLGPEGFRVGQEGGAHLSFTSNDGRLRINGELAANTISAPNIISRSCTNLEAVLLRLDNGIGTDWYFNMDHDGFVSIQILVNYADLNLGGGPFQVAGLISNTQNTLNTMTSGIPTAHLAIQCSGAFNAGLHWIGVAASSPNPRSDIKHVCYISIFRSYR